MRKGYLLGMHISFLCVLILTLAACNSNQTGATSSDTTVAKVDTPVQVAASKMAQMSGYLNILYTDSATFVDLKNEASGKLTFRFYLKAADSLTLGGWSNEGNSPNYPHEPPKPSITLEIGNPSGYEILPGSYFGNLVLYNRTIQKIVTELKAGKKFVLFIPLDPTEHSGQVTYQVRTTNTDPRTLKKEDFDPKAIATDQTNPSPPKGAFN